MSNDHLDDDLPEAGPTADEQGPDEAGLDNASEPGDELPAEDDETDLDSEPEPELDLKQPKVNLTHQRPVDAPLPEGAEVSLMDAVVIMRESHRNVLEVMRVHEAYLEKISDVEDALVAELEKQGKPLTDSDGNAWFRTLLDTFSHAQIDLMGLKATERAESNWAQTIHHNGKELRAGKPRQSLSAGPHTPDELLAYMTKRAGQGTNVDIPLWHSGIWLRLRSPSTTEIVTLQHELAQLRVTLGSQTKGMGFSNAGQALNNLAVNFALQYVIDASVAYKTPTDLEGKIDALDGPFLLLALASAMFPGGLPYVSPCVSDIKTCNHVMKANLAFEPLQRVDDLAISTYQATIMSRRFGQQGNRTNDDELKRYREEHRAGRERIVWFENIGLRLGTPTLMDQREAGDAWVDSIVEMTQGAFNEPPHGTNRNRYISQLGNTTTARQYAHWVKAVLDRDEQATEGYQLITEDREAIGKFLNNVMSTADYSEDFFDAVRDFIEDSMVSMVAIPSYNCPQCATPVAEKFHERFEHLVPLDMLSLFFTLASRKLSYKNPTKTRATRV